MTSTEIHFKLEGRTLTLSRLVWIALAALTLILFIATIPAAYQSDLHRYPEDALRQLGLSPELAAIYRRTIVAIFYLGFVAVGVIIFSRQSNDWPAFLVSLTLVTSPFASVSAPFILANQSVQWGWLIALLYSGLQAFSTSVIYVFPDGRFVPHWTRWLIAGVGLWALALFLVFPVGVDASKPAPAFNLTVTLGAALLVGTGVLTQIYRYRRVASVTQRQQTKWVIFGLAVAFLIWAIYYPPLILVPSLSVPGLPNVLWSLIGMGVTYLANLVVPICLSFAIMRYQLWGIDFLINRSLVYGALTGLLAALFGVSLLIISRLFQNFSGGPLVAVAISAAIFGAIFQPARRRLQHLVDQRLYSIQIDYEKAAPRPRRTEITEVLQQTHFGAYQNLELIGRGGMAEVYKSIHPSLGTPIAIKILRVALANNPDFRHRFTREAQVVSQFEHPNIVRVFDYGEQAGTPYMVMEYLAGKDLRNFLEERGRLSLAHALPLLTGIADALDYAHQRGVVHRDVKPSNVLIESLKDEGGRMKAEKTNSSSRSGLHPSSFRAVLTDFGIAKILHGETSMTRTGMLGTFDYIAPEQIEASAEVDGRADVYAFGVMVYQMLTGELPFKHNHVGALLIAHLNQPPPDPRELVTDLPSPAAYAIRRALAKNPDERYATAGEFAAELSRNA